MFKPLIITTSLLLTACTTATVAPVDQPRILKRVKPNYPIYAFKNRIGGVVEFKYDVGADGKISEMRIIKSEPQHLFDDVAITAMAQWRFETNKPRKNLHQTLIFKINSDNNLVPGALK